MSRGRAVRRGAAHGADVPFVEPLVCVEAPCGAEVPCLVEPLYAVEAL